MLFDNDEIIICGNKNCKSKNCIIRYDYYEDEDIEDDYLREFYLCLDCGETELIG